MKARRARSVDRTVVPKQHIDLVVSRMVVLATMAGFIAFVYALAVVLADRFTGGTADGLVLPIVATAVVAVAFEPVRRRAQRWADRLVYGWRATPYEVLSDLTAKLADAEQGEGILERMASVLGKGTGADRATVWLGSPGGDMRPGATWPSDSAVLAAPDLGNEDVFPVTHAGDVVGALELLKPSGSALSSTERALVSNVAASAGLVLGYQLLNDSLEERAEDLEESRRRLVDAQDVERKRLERDLHDRAEQRIVALKHQLEGAARLASRRGADEIEERLANLADEAELAVNEVRSLARGIYPPVLENEGLSAAISGLASSSPIEVDFDGDAVDRYTGEIEAAVYFDIAEAVTNAAKHAVAPIRIELEEARGALRFTVSDSGPGFDPAVANGGSGIHNMADRLDAIGGHLTIHSTPGGRTTVTGEIPLSRASV